MAIHLADLSTGGQQQPTEDLLHRGSWSHGSSECHSRHHRGRQGYRGHDSSGGGSGRGTGRQQCPIKSRDHFLFLSENLEGDQEDLCDYDNDVKEDLGEGDSGGDFGL